MMLIVFVGMCLREQRVSQM